MVKRPAKDIVTKSEKQVLKDYIHDPGRLASSYVRFAQDIKESPGVKFGCVLDDHLIPLRAGRSLTIVARPGHGKTSFGGALCLKEGRRLMNEGIEDRYVAHITWEQPVEELESMYHDASGAYSVTDIAWGRVSVEDVIRNTVKRPALPVWLFGESIYHTSFNSPVMTVDKVMDAIHVIYKQWGKLPSLLFFDYLQDIPVPDERDRYNQVSAAMRRVKRLSVQAKCPVIIGVQASARVDDYAQPIPTIRDAEWSNVIGQKTDVQISLWRPVRTHPPREHPVIEVGGVDYTNNDKLLVIKLLKQRFDKGHGVWGVRFDPATIELRDFKLTSVNFEEVML